MFDSVHVPTSDSALHTKDAVVRDVEGFHFVNNPKTGALSVLNDAEMIAFDRLGSEGGAQSARAFLTGLGLTEQEAKTNIEKLVTRLTGDGWARRALPTPMSQPLESVYFTLTRECNLACPYCYQGLRKRARKIMPLIHVKAILSQIRAINPQSHIIVTGGEPMMHPDFFEILDLIQDRGFTVSLLTNGAYIDDEAARKLTGYDNIERIQVSIDGLSKDINAISRGTKSYGKVMSGIRALAKYKAPLLLAPTIHDGNAHEIVDIARFAVEMGGSISANDLRHQPRDENDSLTLSTETFREVKAALMDYLTQAAIDDPELGDRMKRLSTRSCSSDPVNSTFICGVAYSLVDIDWNGDVYPCHLLKSDELVLGNILVQSFEDIFQIAKERGMRTKSHEIGGCSTCSFMSVCGSGCRASTYFELGTFEKSSPSCSDHRWSNTQRLLKAKRNSI